MKQKKGPPRQEAPVLADHPIKEPLLDWKPLTTAQFYCFSNRYIPSDKEWQQALKNEILEISRTDRLLSTPRLAPQGAPPTWEFEEQRFGLIVRGMEVESFILPGLVFVSAHSRLPEDWLVGLFGYEHPDNDSYWANVPSHRQVAAKWHRSMLVCLFWTWRSSFENALARGSAMLMARKDSVLAPFERVAWDQWQYFRIEDQDKRAVKRWYDPKAGGLPTYAVGPARERLYSIHVAPGVSPSNENTTEEKCLQRIKQFIEDYPDRCPVPVDDLVRKIRDEYPQLSLKHVHYCVFWAVTDCNKPQWLRPGRPKKNGSDNPAQIDKSHRLFS
jgi:hypothetical protein